NIMDNQYFSSLLPMLVERGIKLDLFYEMKANIKEEQVALLQAAGVTRIQPGIESFSTSLLKAMRKGVRAIQNVQLLKWCAEYQISPEWNFLWGFPGEMAKDYLDVVSLIKKVRHYKPPNGIGRLRLDRFSPYFENSKEFFKNVEP